jgi:hypothetical protein
MVFTVGCYISVSNISSLIINGIDFLKRLKNVPLLVLSHSIVYVCVCVKIQLNIHGISIDYTSETDYIVAC